VNFAALVVDYDGTIATMGRVAPHVSAALRRVRESGRTLVLATGRILSELLDAFPELPLFHLVVAEDGALIYDPSSKEETLLSAAPPSRFLEALSERSVSYQTGRVIVASQRVHADQIRDVIKELNLPLELSFNKSSLMILRGGVNKAQGLKAALERLKVPLSHTVGVGDAENDQPFLQLCGLSVTLANGVSSLQQSVDKIMPHPNGDGVCLLIEELLSGSLEGKITKRKVL
jgi:hydroxymethylpyrimidine pyrophosphatase-like HAD family hydrolase